jgi:ATP-dependent protease ClpP protease subunit
MNKRYVPILLLAASFGIGSSTASAITASGTIATVPFSMKIEASTSDTATITMSGRISEWRNSAANFEYEVKDLIAKGHVNAHIKMNGPGGSTLEAAEIYNIIKSFTGKVTGEGGALVASAYTYIACACSEFTVNSNTQGMIHKPMGGFSGNEDQIESDLKLLKNVTADFKKVYAAKFNKSEEEIESLWAKGNHWMNAEQMKALGLATSVKETPKAITAEDVLMLEACAAPVVPKATAEPTIPNSKTTLNIMEKSQIIASLGLQADATDADIQAAITQNKEAAEAAKTSQRDRHVADVKAFLDGAEKEKKITGTQRAKYDTLSATAEGFASVKEIVAEATPVVQASKELIPGSKKADNVDRSKWTFADYQEKDPAAFADLLESDPTKAEALTDTHYATND